MPETFEFCADLPRTHPGGAVNESDCINARARFFPAWWTHIGASRESPPRYRVICFTTDEIALARSVEPDFVEAEYFLCK